MDYLQVFLPHCTQIAHFGPEVLECEVALGLPQLGGGQLLLEARHAVLGDVLPLPLAVLEIRPVVSTVSVQQRGSVTQYNTAVAVLLLLFWPNYLFIVQELLA